MEWRVKFLEQLGLLLNHNMILGNKTKSFNSDDSQYYLKFDHGLIRVIVLFIVLYILYSIYSLNSLILMRQTLMMKYLF